MVKSLEINKKKVGFLRFKQNNRGYLVTNDLGNFLQLTDTEFRDFISGTLDKTGEVYDGLARRFFIKDDFAFSDAVERYRFRNSYLFQGPVLHIVVVTLRCNFKCVYCQANRKDHSKLSYDMDKATAKNIVDRIFESPGRQIVIEFQGGEPLLNWPVVEFIIEYAQKKNAEKNRNLSMRLVTNLSLMTDRIYDYLIKNRVSICTSLDGPEKIHNANRSYPGYNSHKVTTSWIRKIRKKEEQRHIAGKKEYTHSLSALLTITRRSLSELPRIIDEYLAYGFQAIHLRKLSCLGFSGGKAKDVIGYSAGEFIDSWKRAMDYIIDLNINGTIFSEKATTIFLKKIFSPQDPGYLDLRSPCGAGVGQLAYNYDGKVYTCDEARTLEDDTFVLGNANRDDYSKIASSPIIQNALVSSLLDNLICDECVYKPYCGVCPVLNYALQGNMFPQMPCTDGCKINSAMLGYIFEKLEVKDVRSIFHMWIQRF